MDRDYQAWEERVELRLANIIALGGGRLAAHVAGGAVAQQRIAGGQIGVGLEGQTTLVSSSDRARTLGGFGKAGLDWQSGHLTMFAAGEAIYVNDSSRSYAGKGGVRVTW
ncbi:hypothetical protein BRAS3809_4380001 [Bradyrhizobium sp. STM 3809]|nr:hypothetical protein BRAS3809_4380001 [Bradyrhizobium sp. STM 3809]